MDARCGVRLIRADGTEPVPPKLRIDPGRVAMPRFAPANLNQGEKVASQLFRTKSPDSLMREAAAPERQMKRTLGAFDLTCIGIGAIIGSGIFALAGTAAAGEQIEASIWKTPLLNFAQSWISHTALVFGRPGAGPAVMLS